MKIDLNDTKKLLLQYIEEALSNKSNLNKEKTVYLLVQIRKVLEISEIKNGKFITLLFFINWTVHSRINRNSSWFNFIKEKVKYSIGNSKKILESKKINRIIDEKHFWHTEFQRHIGLQSLKEDLITFAHDFNIDIESILLSKNWNIFRGFLMEVLADTPIEIDDKSCPITTILIHSKKNQTNFVQGEGLAKYVCDYVLIYKDDSFDTISILDGTL